MKKKIKKTSGIRKLTKKQEQEFIDDLAELISKAEEAQQLESEHEEFKASHKKLKKLLKECDQVEFLGEDHDFSVKQLVKFLEKHSRFFVKGTLIHDKDLILVIESICVDKPKRQDFIDFINLFWGTTQHFTCRDDYLAAHYEG